MAVPRTSNEPPTLEALREKQAEIREALVRHGGSNLRIYGSVVRGDAGPSSDIDLLVDMEQGRSLLDLATLHLELEDLFGYAVEIGTDVKPRLRQRVLNEAILL